MGNVGKMVENRIIEQKRSDKNWAIVKTLGSRKGHSQIWEGPIAYHTFVQ